MHTILASAICAMDEFDRLKVATERGEAYAGELPLGRHFLD